MNLKYLAFLLACASLAETKHQYRRSLTEALGQEIIQLPGLGSSNGSLSDSDGYSSGDTSAGTGGEGEQVDKELVEAYKDTDYSSEYSGTESEKKVEAAGNKLVQKVEVAGKKSLDAVNTRVPPINESKLLRRNEEGASTKAWFKFQPDLDDKEEVARFRTAVDEVGCDRTQTPLHMAVSTSGPGAGAPLQEQAEGTSGGCGAHAHLSAASFALALVLRY